MHSSKLCRGSALPLSAAKRAWWRGGELACSASASHNRRHLGGHRPVAPTLRSRRSSPPQLLHSFTKMLTHSIPGLVPIARASSAEAQAHSNGAVPASGSGSSDGKFLRPARRFSPLPSSLPFPFHSLPSPSLPFHSRPVLSIPLPSALWPLASHTPLPCPPAAAAACPAKVTSSTTHRPSVHRLIISTSSRAERRDH